MNYKFSASFTVLNYWEKGDIDQAVKTYFYLEQEKSQAMTAGGDLHDEWKKETLKTSCLPKIFGGEKLIKPICEEKIIVKLNDPRLSWLELSGKPDCYSDYTLNGTKGKVIDEYKSGASKNSMAYANDHQIGMMALLIKLKDLNPVLGRIWHYNQYIKKSDMFMTFITPQLIKETAEWIEGQATDMHNYLVKNNLYEQFDAGRQEKRNEQ